MMIRMQVAKDLYRSVFVMIELLKMVAMCRARSVSQVIDSIDRAQCPDFGKLVGGPDELVYHLDRVLRAFRPIGSVLNFFLWPRFRFRSQLCNYRSLLIYKAIRCTNTPAEVNIFLRFSGEAANGHCWITI